MSAQRWDALAQALGEQGIAAKVTAKPYAQTRYGRVEHGVSRSITVRGQAGAVVVMDHRTKGDRFWRGWYVWAEDREGIVVREWPADTSRAQVAATVRGALELVGGARVAARAEG